MTRMKIGYRGLRLAAMLLLACQMRLRVYGVERIPRSAAAGRKGGGGRHLGSRARLAPVTRLEAVASASRLRRVRRAVRREAAARRADQNCHRRERGRDGAPHRLPGASGVSWALRVWRGSGCALMGWCRGGAQYRALVSMPP